MDDTVMENGYVQTLTRHMFCFDGTITRLSDETLQEDWTASVSEGSGFTDSDFALMKELYPDLAPEQLEEFVTDFSDSLAYITVESLDAGIMPEWGTVSSTDGSTPCSGEEADC